MGLFGKNKTLDQLQEESELLSAKEDVVSKQSLIAEKEAVIRRLKQEHGSSWRSILGVNTLTDLSTLKTFLRSTKTSMQTSGQEDCSQLSSSVMPKRGRL